MNRLLLSAAVAAVLLPLAARAQSVGIGTTTPAASAALDISSTSQGLLVPRMDSVTRMAIASPSTGLLVFQTGPRQGFYYYGGGSWLFLPDKARSGDNLGNHTATQDVVLNNHTLLLRAAGDYYHGLAYNGTYDGPSLYGYNGGGLGYGYGGATTALRWDNTGLVGVPATLAVGTSGNNNGTAPDLSFGGSGTGEGIGSARSSGNPNQYGIDFYTGFAKRLSLTNTGQLGIGTATPAQALDVVGNARVSGGLVGTGSDLGTLVGVGVRADGGLNIGQVTGNVLLGYSSGLAGQTGGGNVAVGVGSGQSLTSGANNVLAGPNSAERTTSGSGNIFLGYFAGDQNLSGNNNIFLGAVAGQANQTGSSNVAIGLNAGPSVDGLTNTVALGPNTHPAQSNTIVLGNGVSVGIGTATPGKTLDVVGTTRISSLGAGVVMAAADGTLSSTPAGTFGASYIDNQTTQQAGSNFNISGNGTVGSLTVTGAVTGSGSDLGTTVGLGVRADGGLNIGQNTTGNNVYLGFQAGNANTSAGANSTYVGYKSGLSSQGGSGNTFLGNSTGYNNSTGNYNTFVGHASGANGAGGSSNTFVGRYTGINNTADNNTFLGAGSGFNNTSGGGNVFVGTSSGQANATGTNNVALGLNAGPGAAGLTNTIALGTGVQPSVSNTLLLGGTGANAVSVGIGTATPNSTLQVSGSFAVGVVSGLDGGAAPGLNLGQAGYYGLNPNANSYYRLPDPSTCTGRVYYLRNNSASGGLTLNTAGGQFFDGASSGGSNTYGLSNNGSTKTVIAISDGTNWTIIRTGNAN